MSEDLERQIGDLTVRIDHSLCVGFGHCVDESTTAFELDDDLVGFNRPDQVDRETLVLACQACPVEAITVVDAAGVQVAP